MDVSMRRAVGRSGSGMLAWVPRSLIADGNIIH